MVLEKSAKIFLKRLEQITKIKQFLYAFLFWTFTIFSTIFTFLASIMSTIRLAADKITSLKSFASFFQTIETNSAGEKQVLDLWPIFVLWIGVGISLASGLLGFFVIRKKWVEFSKISSAINLEKELFVNKLGKYKNEDREYQFLKKVCYIAGVSRDYVQRKSSVTNEK